MSYNYSIKAGFQQYLYSLNEISNKDYSFADSDICIFMYSNEFKNYISDELDVDPKVLSMSVNDILKMDIVNGKLVDPEQETKDTDGDSQDTIEGTDTTPEEAPSTDTDIAGDSNVQQYGENPTINMGEQQISDMLNDLFETDLIKNIIDTDKSGDLGEEEIQTFINAIKGYDGNGEDISLEDILGAIQAINDETFSLDPEAAEQVEEEVKASKEAEASKASQSTSSGGNVSGSTGAGSTGSTPSTTSGVQEKTLDNMSLDELNDELSSAASERDAKQTALDKARTDADTKVSESKDAENEAYDTYLEGLKEIEDEDETFSEDVDNLKTQIDTKQDEITQRNRDIADQEVTVTNAQSAFDTAKTTYESLNSALSALQATDTSNMDSDKQAELQANIQALTAQRDAAKTAMDDAEKTLGEEENKLDALKNGGDGITSLADLKTELSDLEAQMTELEAQILEAHPEIKELLTAYQEARENTTKTIEETEKAVSKAEDDFKTSQEYVNEVEAAIANYNTKETIKEYCFNDFGEDIIDFAKQFEGYNESDGSANIFLGGSSSSATPWCAAFVEYIMENSGSYDDVPDWYKNIDNKWYCPNIDAAAKNAGAIINASDAQPGDIVLFDWDGDGSKDHVGIVVSNENGQLVTIEGNTSNQVAYRNYSSDDGRITYCKITD